MELHDPWSEERRGRPLELWREVNAQHPPGSMTTNPLGEPDAMADILLAKHSALRVAPRVAVPLLSAPPRGGERDFVQLIEHRRLIRDRGTPDSCGFATALDQEWLVTEGVRNEEGDDKGVRWRGKSRRELELR